jgi:hypothetical protein
MKNSRVRERLVVVGYIVFFGACFVMALGTSILDWTHPDMTSKRLFLTYWREYVSALAIGLAGLLLATLFDDNR